MFGAIWPAGVPSSVHLQNLFTTGLGVGVGCGGWGVATSFVSSWLDSQLAHVPAGVLAGFSASSLSAEVEKPR